MKLNGKLLTLYSQKVLSFHQQSNLLKGDRKSPVTTKYRAHLHMSKLFTTQLTEDNAPVFMGHSCLLLTCPSRSAETQHHCSRGRWHCPAGSRTACQEKLPVRVSAPRVCNPGADPCFPSSGWPGQSQTLLSMPPPFSHPTSLYTSYNLLFAMVITVSSFCF